MGTSSLSFKKVSKNHYMSQVKKHSRYFDSFDAMRFFAFFAVFLAHIGPLYIPFLNYFQHSSGLAVQFFFTLSSFLITYIILEEKKRTGKLNLKNFFVRRILRIWPLYYLMVAFAYATPYLLDVLHLTSSDEGYQPTLWMSVLFLENYKMMFEGQLANVSPLSVMWSLCIEEHFYLIWGIVFYFIKFKHTPIFLTVSIVISFISRIVFMQNGWSMLDITTNLDTFAYGAIPAYLLVRHGEQFEKKIGGIKYSLKYIVVAATLFLFFFIHLIPIPKPLSELFNTCVFGILYSILIAFTIPENNKIKIGRRNIFTRLGKYTYGLYLYHTIIILLFAQVFKMVGIDIQTFSTSVLFLMICLGMVIVVSKLSYQLFEVQFLKLKKYF